jgi:hypothetical protein
LNIAHQNQQLTNRHQHTPTTQILATPRASFAIEVTNTGNVEDGYTAVITQKTGSLTASLQDLDGNLTQQISILRLPGLASCSINLTTSTSNRDSGSITKLIVSNSNPSSTNEVTAQLSLKKISE